MGATEKSERLAQIQIFSSYPLRGLGPLIVLFALILSGCGNNPSQPAAAAAAAPPVTVAEPVIHSVTDWDEAAGRFDAVEEVQIRARVGGFVTNVEFRDGAFVNAGDLLYIIDPRPFEAVALQADGQLSDARAKAELAKRELDRGLTLIQTQAVSESIVDQRRQALQAARAAETQAEGALKAAQLNIEFSHVLAPIAGRASRHLVSVGNLVQGSDNGGGTLLTSIVSLDPIYVYFDMDEATYLKYNRLFFEGKRPSSRENPNPVQVTLTGETKPSHDGKVDFLDNRMDVSTGTLQGRARDPRWAEAGGPRDCRWSAARACRGEGEPARGQGRSCQQQDMNLGQLSINRPILAMVLSIVLLIVGAIAYTTLPVAEYPQVVPPTVVVTTQYPGASAQTVSDTVAAPIEQQINGVEDMLYLYSQATSNGQLTITVTFKLGTDLDKAQVLVQNRVAIAQPQLPEEVQRNGVVTRKNSPDILMVVFMLSPDDSFDQLYISNYALLQVRDQLLRLDGIGDIQIFGARDYSMRLWLDPDKIANLGLTAGDVLAAIKAQNLQITGGPLAAPPIADRAFQPNLTFTGRLKDIQQFEDILVKAGAEGRTVRLRDVARIELGALDYTTNSFLLRKTAVAMLVTQRPGSNALATAKNISDAMVRLKADFPKGLDYHI